MKRLFTLTAAVAALSFALPSQATLIDARFSGTVGSQVNAGFTVGAAIAGTFVYDTVLARYLSFTVGGQSVAPGFASTASLTPDLYSAIYRAQLSPVQQGGNLNSTFVVDLEGLNPWPSGNAAGLLLNTAQLASNLDTAFSSFGFFTANVDGTGVRSVNAALTSLSATAIGAVPEPGTTALLLAGVVAFGLRRFRRSGQPQLA